MTDFPDPLDRAAMKNLTAADLRKLIIRVRLREAELQAKIDALDALIKTIKAHSAALISLRHDR